MYMRLSPASFRAIIPAQSLLVRSYVGLAYNRPGSGVKGIQTVERSWEKESKKEESGRVDSGISAVEEDINKAIKWVSAAPEPYFEVISPGLGSFLLIKLPSDSEIITAPGTALSVSSKIDSSFVTDGALKAIGGKVVGEPLFYQKFATKSSPGDIIVAPHKVSEIAAIKMDGTTEYIVRRDAFLAKSSRISLSIAFQGFRGKGAGITQFITHKVTGRGSLAIASYGGLCRLVLNPEEEYLVNPRNLVAWDSRTRPTKLPQISETIPSPRSPLRRFKAFRNFVDDPTVQGSLQRLDWISQKIFKRIIGGPEFVKLKGPGEFYMRSRVESRYEFSRIMSSLSLANDKLDQLYQQSAIAQPKETVESGEGLSSESPKLTKQANVYPLIIPEDGNPSYYAEVHKGKVIFVPVKVGENLSTGIDSPSAVFEGDQAPLGGSVVQVRRWVSGGQSPGNSTGQRQSESI